MLKMWLNNPKKSFKLRYIYPYSTFCTWLYHVFMFEYLNQTEPNRFSRFTGCAHIILVTSSNFEMQSYAECNRFILKCYASITWT